GDFAVQSRNGQAVELAVAEMRFETSRGVPAVVGPVQHVGAPAVVGAAAFGIGGLAGVEIKFVHLVVIGPVGPGERTVEAVVRLVGIPDVALGQVTAGGDAAAL